MRIPVPRQPRLWQLLVILGVFLIGVVLSHLLWPLPVTTQTVAVAPGPADSGPGVVATPMPDVEGLDQPSARAVLADAGYPANAIKTTTVAAAGDPGRVITQQPMAGATPSASPAVLLTVSSQAPMPNLLGQTRDQASAAVTALHAAPQLKLVSRADKPVGSVIRTTPAAGAAMPAEVTLEIADGGTPVGLADLTPVTDDGCADGRTDTDTVNGTAFSTTIRCQPTPDVNAVREYVLGRHADFVDFTAGTSDQADATTSRIRVITDGKVANTQTVTRGKATHVRVNVTGVLRVRIEVTTSAQNAVVILGDAHVVGTADQMDQLLP